VTTTPPLIAPRGRARAMLVGATALWGLSFPLLRGLELTQHVHAPGVSSAALACADMAFRFLLATLFLLPLYGRQLFSITGLEWSQAGGLAFFAGAGLYLQTLGLVWTDASVTAFLTQLYTLQVPLLVACRDRRRPTLRTLAACLLVLTGAAMLSPGLMAHFVLALGEALIILSTLFIAGQIVWVERPCYAANRPGLVTLLMFAMMGLFFALLFPFLSGTASDAAQLMGAPDMALLMLTTVLFCTVVNFFIMNKWQRWISATEAGLIYCLEPVIATILSSFLPGWISAMTGISYANELLSWTLLAGGTLIVAATVLVATAPAEGGLTPIRRSSGSDHRD
jgi:drug/metabolite transporter (DMT)-like permease